MPHAARISDGPEADRRREILRAAIEVFAKKGYYGCRIADVARAANVAYGLVYHYFKNKEELLQSVFALSWGRFERAIDGLARADGTLAARVATIVDFALGAWRENPMAVRVLILEIARSPVFRQAEKRTAFETTVRATAALFAQAQKRGEMRADVDPFVAAAVLFGAIEVVLTAFVLGAIDAESERDVAAARRGLVEIFLGGVSVDGRARRGNDAGPGQRSRRRD